jgi:hypothetical protein
MSKESPDMPVRFYCAEAGGSPVLDWLRGLDKDDRRDWEVRSMLPSQRIARIILFHQPASAFLLLQ